MEPTFDNILSKTNIHPARVKGMYLFGSRVYGTDNWESDWDIKIIANGTVSNLELRKGIYNIHIITPPDFQKLLFDHQPGALECYFAPDFAKMHENTGKPIHEWGFKLKPSALRHHYCRVSTSSWSKAKKKLQYGEYYSGIKSLFHSIRIPMFGSQIVKYGKIVDFTCANHIWDEICSENWEWVEIVDNFREKHQKVLSDLRDIT